MGLAAIFWFFFALATAIIGFHIHHSIFFSIIDYIFAPFVWIKWVIFQEVNMTIIKASFAWFMK